MKRARARKSGLLRAVRPVSRTVRPVEADRIGKTQGRRAGGRTVITRKVDPLDHVEPAAVEEHVDGQAALIGTLDTTADVLEPGMGGFGLARLIGNASALAIDGDKAAKDGVAPRFDARDGIVADAPEQR